MPRVPIPITSTTAAGVAPPAQTNADAPNDHVLQYNDGAVWLEIVSSDAGSQDVTIITPGAVAGLGVADQVVTVPAGTTRLAGPFAPGVFNQGDGTVNIDVPVSTTLKFRAFHLG